MPRRGRPHALDIRSLKQRFRKLNWTTDDEDLIDWSSIDSTVSYHSKLVDLSREYPQYDWGIGKEYSDEEKWDSATSIDVELTLTWTHGGKYAKLQGSIPAKALKYIRDRLNRKYSVLLPLRPKLIDNPDWDGSGIDQLFEKKRDEDLLEFRKE